MPAYQLPRLTQSPGDREPVTVVVFNDAAAMRLAMASSFPGGCDVWQGSRFVGRVHGPAPQEAKPGSA